MDVWIADCKSIKSKLVYLPKCDTFIRQIDIYDKCGNHIKLEVCSDNWLNLKIEEADG